MTTRHTHPTPPHPGLSMFQPKRYLVIGLGGIGSIVADYLSRFLLTTQPDATLCVINSDQYEELKGVNERS